MNSVLEAQAEGRFSEITERDKEIQASIWALLFLVSELALGFRVLRDRLNARGALQPEDEQLLNETVCGEESLRAAYVQIEQAFQDKYVRVRAAMDNPERVTEIVNEKQEGVTVDLNQVPENKVEDSPE